MLDERARDYEIKDLQPNSEYVLSLRARNLVGDGEPQYGNIQTRDEDPSESIVTVLEVPVRLRAITMSDTSIVVHWTDNSVSRSAHLSPNRYYRVRYNPVDSSQYKYYNTTDTNCMIGDLKPSTQYEFAVKAVKGKRSSAWSMSEVNTTLAVASASPPRDLVAQPDPRNPQNVLLRWLPPRNAKGEITGYIVLYTTDSSKRDREWEEGAVTGPKTEAIIKNLKPRTRYYFKVQTNNENRTPGKFSAMISYLTGQMVSLSDGSEESVAGYPNPEVGISGSRSDVTKFFNEYLIYIIAAILTITLMVSVRVAMILCKSKPQGTPDGKHAYNKNNTGIKPPDLWIHHDQMELKNVEKNPPNQDGASSSGAMTLPRSAHEYESDASHPHSHVTSSLDKRSYVPGYMSKCFHSILRQFSILILVSCFRAATSMTSTIDRSHYPRSYNRLQIDPAMSQQNLSQTPIPSIPQTPENPYSYDSMPSNYRYIQSRHTQAESNSQIKFPHFSNPSITYAPGLAIDVPKAPRGQGHPLQSFSVPGPPPPSLNTTPLISNPNKHNGKFHLRHRYRGQIKSPFLLSHSQFPP